MIAELGRGFQCKPLNKPLQGTIETHTYPYPKLFSRSYRCSNGLIDRLLSHNDVFTSAFANLFQLFLGADGGGGQVWREVPGEVTVGRYR